MSARMRRSRILRTVAAGALAAAGLAIPAAASASFAADDVPTIGAANEIGLNVSALGNYAFDGGRAGLDDRVPDLVEVSPELAQPAVGVRTSTVSAPVVVPDDALWTFDADAFTITSTITEVDVGLRGHQAEIDRCDGPVVSDYGAYGKVIGEHNHCGGAYVLELEVGDAVRLTGYEAGYYVVAFLKDVPKKNTSVSVLSGADLYLQTCHFTGGQMRLVALTPQEA